MRSLFITGTDTNVGKTQVASMILRELIVAGHRMGAYKPVCSGAVEDAEGIVRWDDLERLSAAIGDQFPIETIGPQRFLAPLAPPIAARLEQRSVEIVGVDQGFQSWRSRCNGLIIEGAGGWLCPLTDTQTLADWVARWQIPVLIVARRGLGTINHTLLTIAAIRSRRVPIGGVILNQASPADNDPSSSHNAHEIEARTGVPVLGELLWEQTELRQNDRIVRMNWWSLMKEPADDGGTMNHGMPAITVKESTYAV